jgi:cytochrome c-type biogenesis protein CcmH
MSTFLVIAAVMAAIAAACVVWPLVRNAGGRVLAAAAGVLVIGMAAALYPLWSNWNWHPEPKQAAAPDVLAMVARLEQHMKDAPNDTAGWLMLGRSYVALERFDDAVRAYQHAHELDLGNTEAMLGLGEAMSLAARDVITPAAADLFEKALTLAPDDPRALLYGGFAAAVRGDRGLARTRWMALKALHPPPQIEAMLDARIAELGLGPATPAGAAPAGAPAPGVAAAATGTEDSSAQATVNLSIAPALKSHLTTEAPLFVFAREPGAAGPPLAVKRLTSAAIGTRIQLSSADSMVQGRALSAGQRISITARISFSGQPLPASGDLYGELTYQVGQDGVRDLVIDQVAK